LRIAKARRLQPKQHGAVDPHDLEVGAAVQDYQYHFALWSANWTNRPPSFDWHEQLQAQG